MKAKILNKLNDFIRPFVDTRGFVVFSVMILALSVMVAGYRVGKHMALSDSVQCQGRKVVDETGHSPIRSR